jgi:single-strand DNA-binding protein
MSTTVIGRLTADPEIKTTGKGTSVANFSVAVNRKKGDEEYVSFFDVTVWGTLAEGVRNLKKGDRVIVHGYLNQDRYENKEGKTVSKTVIMADAVGKELRFAAEKPAPEEDF